jgi:hypothetical protein
MLRVLLVPFLLLSTSGTFAADGLGTLPSEPLPVLDLARWRSTRWAR